MQHAMMQAFASAGTQPQPGGAAQDAVNQAVFSALALQRQQIQPQAIQPQFATVAAGSLSFPSSPPFASAPAPSGASAVALLGLSDPRPAAEETDAALLASFAQSFGTEPTGSMTASSTGAAASSAAAANPFAPSQFGAPSSITSGALHSPLRGPSSSLFATGAAAPSPFAPFGTLGSPAAFPPSPPPSVFGVSAASGSNQPPPSMTLMSTMLQSNPGAFAGSGFGGAAPLNPAMLSASLASTAPMTSLAGPWSQQPPLAFPGSASFGSSNWGSFQPSDASPFPSLSGSVSFGGQAAWPLKPPSNLSDAERVTFEIMSVVYLPAGDLFSRLLRYLLPSDASSSAAPLDLCWLLPVPGFPSLAGESLLTRYFDATTALQPPNPLAAEVLRVDEIVLQQLQKHAPVRFMEDGVQMTAVYASLVALRQSTLLNRVAFVGSVSARRAFALDLLRLMVAGPD